MYRIAFKIDKGFKLGTKVYTTLEEAMERFLVFKEEFNNSNVVIILETLDEVKVVFE